MTGVSETTRHAPLARDGPSCATSELGLRRSRASNWLLWLYGRSRGRVRRWAYRMAGRLEGGVYYSQTMRDVMRRYCGVTVGAYSYGGCLMPGLLPAGTTIGRYCSIATDLRVFLRNHPTDWLSTHPFFYNRAAGFVPADTIACGSLQIGHDAWVGVHTMITPGCRRIGVGAVVGGGSVVTHDVDDFAIVAGNPARLLRYRFPEELRRLILDTRWWERPVEEVARAMDYMTRPLGAAPWQHPLLRCSSTRSTTDVS